MLAFTGYPLLDAFWTVLWIVGFFIWVWLVIAIFMDLFRSRDRSGWSKAAWVVGIFFLPVLGVLAYLIVHGGRMHERAAADAAARETATRDYIRSVAGGGSTGTADELAKLATLRDSGVLTPEEFEREKAHILSHAGGPHAGGPSAAQPAGSPPPTQFPG